MKKSPAWNLFIKEASELDFLFFIFLRRNVMWFSLILQGY